MKNVLSTVWKLNVWLVIKEVGERLFIFNFEDNGDKVGVLQRQPWSFNKSLLVLANYEGLSSSEEIVLQWCPFWVQIHGLSLAMMIEKIDLILGESVGDVEEVDSDGEQMA